MIKNICKITKIYLKIDDELVGAILLKDEAKHGTKEAIQALNSRGIVTKMFTGDNKKAAKQIAEELGISPNTVENQLASAQKQILNELQKEKLAGLIFFMLFISIDRIRK